MNGMVNGVSRIFCGCEIAGSSSGLEVMCCSGPAADAATPVMNLATLNPSAPHNAGGNLQFAASLVPMPSSVVALRAFAIPRCGLFRQPEQ